VCARALVCLCEVRMSQCVNALTAGEIYEGYWEDGCYEGTGLISNPKTNLLHRGEFEKGMRHGPGISFNADGSFLDANWIQNLVDNSSDTRKNIQLQKKDSKRIQKQLKEHAKKSASKKNDVESKLDSISPPPPLSFDPPFAQNSSSKKKGKKCSSDEESTKPASKSEYDRFSDSLVSWNKDVCRKETGTIAGKGNPHSQLTYCSHELLCLLPLSPHICNCLPSGVFAMTNLCEESVVAKYEGHLVSEDGTIQIRCTRTNILFNYRAELNRELAKLPMSREHCASMMVTVTYFAILTM